ncbi:hypothetical protein KFL_007880020 [Klebsormidium nitens]|uniref:WRC domain-containing protein n=1 Tax=Klebsormidium nitens TaxID=105231 RepID=A0A1Y1IQC6_KLENI|nr:hypothetical protein KFL_007880020 [Klebsormidium nitens]|eukprot:GAQ91451.1 hypothetical protein KFL_007880020 [Klebsormidium nitens]
MGLEVHSEPSFRAEARTGNGTLESRCRECSITTSAEQHAEGGDSLCFTCGLFALTERGEGCFEEHVGSEPLKTLNTLENKAGGVSGSEGVSDERAGGENVVSGPGEANAGVSGAGAGGDFTAQRHAVATPNFNSSERAGGAEFEKLGLQAGGAPDAKLGVEAGVESHSAGGIRGKAGVLLTVSGVDPTERPASQNPSAEIPATDREDVAPSPKAQSFPSPAPQSHGALCVHCKGKPVFNKKESLCKSCAHAKWRYGWEEFPQGWKPGDRLKGIEKKMRGGAVENENRRPTSPGKRGSLSRLEQERERVLAEGWKSVAKRERTTVRSLRAGANPSWTRYGEEHFPWDKPSLGGGKGVLAALLAAEGSAHLLDRKLADSLSRKDLSPKVPPEAMNSEKHSGIDILREAANQERAREQGAPGGRTAIFSKGLPRLETENTEEEEVLETMRIMSPATLQQTVYPNEPASLVKVAVAAQVLLEIATSPRDPPGDTKPHDETQSSEQWKRPPPSRFVASAAPFPEAAASSLGPENDDLRSRVGENQPSYPPSKWGDHELDDLPLRSPDLDVHDEMQLGGEAVSLEDLGVLKGGKRRSVTLPIQTGNFPPRIVTDGWTPRLDADPPTLGTATDGWTPHQDLEGFTPRGEGLNGLTPRGGEGGELNNTPRSKTPSFHDIAANVFKAGRAAAIAGRRGGFQRPPSADMKAKSPLGEDVFPGVSPRRTNAHPQPSVTAEESTPPEEDDEDSNEMSPSANRRKRKLKARQAQDTRPGDTASGEEGKADSGGSEQDAPIVSPGIHKRGRTRAVLGRNTSGTAEEGSRDPGQAAAEARPGGAPGKGPIEPPKKRKGSWGGARRRGEKVVLPDSEEEEAILPRIESASEASRGKRPRPSVSEEARKSSGGSGLLDLVKGRWDDAQRLRDRATAKRAEAERLKRVAETKQRLAQRLIEKATELGNWPPGRKAKADERARRQQAAKKRNADETETEAEVEDAPSDEGSDDDEDFSLDGDPSGKTPDEDWGDEEGDGSEKGQEGESERMLSVEPASTVPDQERCVTSDSRGWRCPRPHLPGSQKCDRHDTSNQPRSYTKSETSSRRPEEAATADSCPPFVDPLEPFKPKKHFGFRGRTSFRPEHMQHLALRPPGASPDPKPEGDPPPEDPPGDQPREGFLDPEELLQLAKARQLKRARSARRHGPEVPGTNGPGADAGGSGGPGVSGGSPGEVAGETRNGGGESGSEERLKRAKLSPGEDMAELLTGDPTGVLQDGRQPNGPTGQLAGVKGLGVKQSVTNPPIPGGFVQMVQSAAQTEPQRSSFGEFGARVDVARLDPVGVNPFAANPVLTSTTPLSSTSVPPLISPGPSHWAGRAVGTTPPLTGPWEVPGRPEPAGFLNNGVAPFVDIGGPLQPLTYRPQNGLTSAPERGEVSTASQVGISGDESTGFLYGPVVLHEEKQVNGINGTQSGPYTTYLGPAVVPLPGGANELAGTNVAAYFDEPHSLLNNGAPLPVVSDLAMKLDQPGREGNGAKTNGTNGVHRASSKRENNSGMGVTRSRAIEDGLPVGRTYTLPVELKLPVELRQPMELQPFVQRGKRQTTKKKKRIPPPIDGIDDSMRCTKTGGSGWRCNQRRLEGYAKCERHMEIVAKRSRVEATKPAEDAPKEGPEMRGPENEVAMVEEVK